MQNYPYGIRQEDRVAGALQRLGYSTGYSPGSRGPWDIFADRGGRHLDIQVKAVSTGVVRAEDAPAALVVLQDRLSAPEESRLLRSTTARRRHAAVSLANGDYFWLWRLRADGYDLLHHGWLPSRPLSR